MSDIKLEVEKRYGEVARTGGGCCGSGSSCCPSAASASSAVLGYDLEDLAMIPEDADLGLGCGNPISLASLSAGERVLDLGCGGGIDCFIAARKVGPTGHVIGVDMTPDMIALARRNAEKAGLGNVEFRLGEIEHLPVADASVDVVISNCVINLVPDKHRAFAEAFRVLAPGGRLLVSDIVVLGEMPQRLRESARAYTGCLAGAVTPDEYLAAMRDAGLSDVEVVDQNAYCADADDPFVRELAASADLSAEETGLLTRLFASVRVSARKDG